MTMAELMREVANLPPAQKDELAAYLVHLRLGTDVAWRSEMSKRIDDRDPAHWVSLEDWKIRISAD